mgnify:CR=1 FL=1
MKLLENKIAIITGASRGIGMGISKVFAAHGAHVAFTYASSEAPALALEKELTALGVKAKAYKSDASKFEQAEALVTAVVADFGTIDILINNAGVFKTSSEKTKDGLDIRMSVNYIAPYILTESIVPVLEKGTNTRIVNLSSAAQSTVKKGILPGVVSINASDAYAQSKLALTMWSFHFAKQLPNITTIAVNPGSLLNTKMANEAYGQHWSPAEKGVNIIYDLATSDAYKDASGKYFDNDKGDTIGRFSAAHPDVYDDFKVKELLKNTDLITTKI